MGGYRVKSGQNLPDYNTGNLPNLPKLGSLNKASNAQESAAEPKNNDFALADDIPTDIGSTDDILAAVGGIDGWDSLSDSSSGIISSSENVSGTDLSSLIEKAEDQMTSVMTSPFAQKPEEAAVPQNNLSESSNLPSIKSDLNAASAKELSNLPSIKGLNAPSSSDSHPVVSANKVPSIDNLSSLKPRVTKTESPAPIATAAASVTSKPQAAAAPAAPVTAETPATQNSENQNMTDEEQLAEILNSMTPEERAEYEAYSAQQEQLAIEARRAKQRELIEMYGNTNSIEGKKSAPVGLIIAIIVIIGIFGAGIFWLLTTDHEKPQEQQTVQEQQPEVERVYERAAPLNTYSVNINTNGASLLYINGVETPINGSSYEFATGHMNTIMAYANGMTPYFRTFDSKSQVTETIDIEMEPAALYLKGIIKFRLTDPTLEGAGLKVSFDGHSIGSLNTPITDVVLGRPHILTIEKEGLAKHIHFIWPDSKETTVTIPELQTPDMAMGGTKAYIKLPSASGKPVGVRISTGSQVYNREIVATVVPGAMIEYQIEREQRQPLNIALIPDGYGTLALDTSLLRESIGKSIVSFNRPAGSTLRVCMRRYGELICPNMEGETTVPSGLDWEFFGAEGTDNNLHPIRGGQLQELQSSRKYGFNVSVDAHGTFKLNQASYAKIKKEGEK